MRRSHVLFVVGKFCFVLQQVLLSNTVNGKRLIDLFLFLPIIGVTALCVDEIYGR